MPKDQQQQVTQTQPESQQEPAGDIYRFNTSESPDPPKHYMVRSYGRKSAMTNVLDVHYRFTTDRPSEYVAIFEKRSSSTVLITVITSALCVGLPFPSLSFRIQGGPRHELPTATRYPIEVSYPPAFLVVPNTATSSAVPRRIIQTWPTHFVSQSMGFAVDAWIRLNPEYEYLFYDDEDSLQFIKTNFNSYVIQAYERLESGSAKADLFRYCFLYVHGGVYVHMKAVPQVPLYAIVPPKTTLVLTQATVPEAVASILMASPPQHPCIEFLIRQITWTVLTCTQDQLHLDLTGPRIAGQIINRYLGKDKLAPYPAVFLGPTTRSICMLEDPPRKIRIVNPMQRTLVYGSYETYNSDLVCVHLTRDWGDTSPKTFTPVTRADFSEFFARPLLPPPAAEPFSSISPLPSPPLPPLPSLPPSLHESTSADDLSSK